MQLKCQACGGAMTKKRIGQDSFIVRSVKQILVLGLGIALCLTVIGAIVGVPLILGGLLYSGKYQNVWKCKGCGAFIPRA